MREVQWRGKGEEVTDLFPGLYPARWKYLRRQCLRYLDGYLTAEGLKALPSIQGAAKNPVLRKRMNGYIRYTRAYRRRRVLTG